MSEDTISRQEAYDALMAEPLKWDDSSVWESARCHQWMMDMDVIKALPSAKPERKTGKWEIYIISMIDGEGCRCSECGFEGAPYWDFCPNCGSYNGGEQDGE